MNPVFKRCIVACVGLLSAIFADAALSYSGELTVGDSKGFRLCDSYILTGESESETVKTVSALFGADVERVTGHRPEIMERLQKKGLPIVIGTVGGNGYIDGLISSGKLDAGSITGGWEQFLIKSLKNPFPGVDEALVIAGSDRRGVAYGLFSVSEAIGVSPWYWWADVPVGRRPGIRVMADAVSTKPTVKYRGIFINDEDWGLKPWASTNFEKELGDVGPKTYEKVCELLLRLKGNMLAPAMHSCTGAFYSHPESKEVSDRYGIIITTSHCEPMLFNNAAKSEWDKERDGEWNYLTNKATIFNKMDSRVKEAAACENIYTTAMRGVHDEGMRGNLPKEKQVEVLETVISDQRGILENRLGVKASEVPQIFVPYKETLDLYQSGLDLPEDITIVWPDDNYGYMKHLSDRRERGRSGSSGVYYHTSYLGTPHDYLWLCTVAPALMYEELKKSYDFGADRYWLLNVGDIKPAEMTIQLFLDMAWDINAFDYEKVNDYQAEMLSEIFGGKYKEKFRRMLDTYYRLAWDRKPEYMGWEWQWDSKELEQLKPTEYSFGNYNDARNRILAYSRLSDAARDVMRELPDSLKASFFDFFGYPAMASWQMNRKFLMSQLNKELAETGDFAGANWAAGESRAAYDSIAALTKSYNTMLAGKWNGMMSVPPGYVAKYHLMPELKIAEGVRPEAVSLAPEKSGNKLERCAVVDLSAPVVLSGGSRVIDGIGYDWKSLQLGESRPGSKTHDVPKAVYNLPAIEADSVTVTVYALPFFPVNDEIGTKYAVSLDNGKEMVAEYLPEEWSHEWKSNVLRNGVPTEFKFPIDRSVDSHTLSFKGLDPGMIIERIVVDWGGLKDSYVGPSPYVDRWSELAL